MRVIALDRLVARCSAKGVEREANLLLLQDEGVVVGDYVVVHLGYAIRSMSAEEARSAWELYDQILAAEATPPAG